MLDFGIARKTTTESVGVSHATRPLVDVIKQGSLEVSPTLARRILGELHFEGQRKVSAEQAELYAEAIRRELFLPHTQIAFCRVGSRLYLVNGQHRLTGVAIADLPLEFQVVIYPCASEAEVQQLYGRFDTMLKKRTDEQVLNAFNLSGKAGIAKMTARGLYRAMPYILFGFKTGVSERDLKKMAALVDRRLDACKPWYSTAKLLEECLADGDTKIRNMILNSAGTTSVALAILKHQPEKGKEFWAGVCANDGLRKGDPRHTLVNALLTKMFTSQRNLSLLSAAYSWNAFYEGRQLSLLRFYQKTPVQILGTPYSGKRG